MNLSILAKLEASSQDLLLLLNTSIPDSIKFNGTPGEIIAASDNLFNLWRKILIDDVDIPIEQFEWNCPKGHKHIFKGDELRGRLLLEIATIYNSLMVEYIAKRSTEKSPAFPKSLVIARFEKFLPNEERLNVKPRSADFQFISYEYFYTLFSLYFTKLFIVFPPIYRSHINSFEFFSHRGLRNLFNRCFHVRGDSERNAARVLIEGLLDIANDVYSETTTWNKEHHMGVFSSIRLEELSLLSKRDDALQKRYGAKSIEKVFENQLALIMQSFGLYVISTRTGQSTVDLVCISGVSDQRTTFLVEAKTTKSKYTLPTKDSRALRDYISVVKRSLTTLPPLSFVLIVGSEPAATIKSKITQLEAMASVPVRFIKAQQIASLRERIPGPLPLGIFINNILTGEAVISDGFVDTIVRGYETEQNAHKSFVESMLSAHGVVPYEKECNSNENDRPSTDN